VKARRTDTDRRRHRAHRDTGQSMDNHRVPHTDTAPPDQLMTPGQRSVLQQMLPPPQLMQAHLYSQTVHPTVSHIHTYMTSLQQADYGSCCDCASLKSHFNVRFKLSLYSCPLIKFRSDYLQHESKHFML